MCGVNREEKRGYCGCGSKTVVAKIMLHNWEEPCISVGKGSGAIFFSGCNLRCNYCQNADISRNIKGKVYSAKGLADEMLSLQLRGAANINLVTPTPYVIDIIESVKIAKAKGLTIPVVYNTSGYECEEVIESLRGIVDVWLTDFKYYDNELANKYSKVRDYREVTTLAIDKMVELTGGKIRMDDNGVMTKGVIIRHLVLPSLVSDTEKILDLIADRWWNKVLISLMRQYTPEYAQPDCDLRRRLTAYEYRRAVNHALELNLEGFSQDADSAITEYTPDFD